MIENRRRPANRVVARIAGVAALNMSGRFADRRGAVVAGEASTHHEVMIYPHDGDPGRIRVAALAVVRCANVLGRPERCPYLAAM